ncbi:twin-arginine translocation signal domain-containing protein [Streptomyces sp. NPDC001340]
MARAKSDRRGFLRTAAAVAAAGTVVLVSGSAYAVQPHSQAGKAMSFPLPPVGTDIPCSMYAANVPFKLNPLGALTLDFKGGINFTVRTSNPDGIVLEVQGFRMEADLSPSTPRSGTVIVLTRSNETLTPLSVLTSAGQLLVHLSLTVTSIDKATGEETGLGSTDPAKYATLRSENVNSFPPVNQLWTLKEPVTLYEPGGSAAQGSPVVGTLEGFNVIVNQSA